MKVTRSMYYQVRYEEGYALVSRLTDGKRADLHMAAADVIIDAIEALERKHPSLGTKPSAAFCRDFDAMCAAYYADEDDHND